MLKEGIRVGLGVGRVVVVVVGGGDNVGDFGGILGDVFCCW